jgi:hypothetical protein
MPGIPWKPSDLLVLKLRHRQAVCMRVWEVQSQTLVALDLIFETVQLRSNDPNVLEEMIRILRWCLTGDRSW